MPKRSWLAKAKSIHDLGGHFYVPSASRPWNDRRDELATRKWDALFDRPLPVAESDRPYFGSRMHDSTVLGIERLKGSLRVRLDAIDARDLSHALAEALGVPPVDRVWPIDLVLHDAAYWRVARESLRGGLRFVDRERLGRFGGEGQPEFLYDWFFEGEGRIQWIAQLWSRGGSPHDRPGDVFLMVDAIRATAEDRCAEAFAEAYGPGAALLYVDARSGIDDRLIDFNVWDSKATVPYLVRRMAARGLTRSDFHSGPVPFGEG